MFFIILSFIKLLTGILSIKNNLKVVGYYLLGNLGLDVLNQIIQYYQHYPKPYTGIGFLLFCVTTFCYLANASWLSYCAGWIIKNKTLKQVSILSLASILPVVLISYPTLHGLTILLTWYAFYATMNLTTLGLLLINLRKHLSFSTAIMCILCLGGLVELLLINILHYSYWLISICNIIFYLTILFVGKINHKYIHLLKP